MTPQPAPARLTDADGDPKVLHVWVTAGHTLCELETGDYITDRASELAAVDATACGPCLLIVSRVRREACALLELAGERVAPDLPSEAWRLLDKSGWGRRVDIKTFLRTTPELDARSRFDAVRYAVDPESVADLVLEMAAVRARERGAR